MTERRARLRLGRGEHWLLAALAVWTLAPVAVTLVGVIHHGGVWTGLEGDDPIDEAQYLGWVRDSGAHGLASGQFGMVGSGHVYLQPMWLISGLLWRAGPGIQLGLLIWLPVAALALTLGAVRFSRRFVGGNAGSSGVTGPSLAAATVGVFFISPILWVHLGNGLWSFLTDLGAFETANPNAAWADPPAAIAIGLTALVLLGCAGIVDTERAEGRRLALIATGAALTSWLHSWQGETVIIAAVLLALLSRRRAVLLSLGCVAGAGALPLIYQLLLTRFDASWKVVSTTSDQPGARSLTGQLLVVLGPLLLAAGFGVWRSRPRSLAEATPLIWLASALAVWAFLPEYPPHALDGLALPLAVLGARGWPTGRPWQATGRVLVVLATIPGCAYLVHFYAQVRRADPGLYVQSDDQSRAFSWLATQGSGGVLTTYPLSLLVPALTDHAVWDGHLRWTPDGVARAEMSADLLAGRLTPQQTQSVVSVSRVRFVVAPCGTAARASAELSRDAVARKTFGCAIVYRFSP